jgi:hypothetical protein
LIEVARHPKPLPIPDPSLQPGETAPIESLTFRYFVRAQGTEPALESVRRALGEWGILRLEEDPEAGEFVAFTAPLQEGYFQEQMAKLRAQSGGAIQVIRVLE